MALINGGSGNDFLTVRVGESDEIRGNDGNDTIVSTAPDVTPANAVCC